MYSRRESSKIKQEFWTAFGQYLTPVLSAEGERVNWVNYRTGVSYLQFRMDADNKAAEIAIEIYSKDDGIRQLFYEQLLELRPLLHEALGESWQWDRSMQEAAGRTISRVHASLPDVNIFRREDWPTMIAFLKQRIIALDRFWSEARYAFEMLE